MGKKKRWNYTKKKRDQSSWNTKLQENQNQIKFNRKKLKTNQSLGR